MATVCRSVLHSKTALFQSQVVHLLLICGLAQNRGPPAVGEWPRFEWAFCQSDGYFDLDRPVCDDVLGLGAHLPVNLGGEEDVELDAT